MHSRNCASFFWTQEQNLLTVLCSWDRDCSIWRHPWRANSPMLNSEDSFHFLHSMLGLMPLTLLSSGRAVLGWCTEKWHILWLYSLSPPTSSPNKEQSQSPSPSLCQTEPYRGFSTNPSVLGGCWSLGLLHSAFLSAVHKTRRSFLAACYINTRRIQACCYWEIPGVVGASGTVSGMEQMLWQDPCVLYVRSCQWSTRGIINPALVPYWKDLIHRVRGGVGR